jgi:FkbM family methyltransferase
MIHRRSLSTILAAPFSPRHWRAGMQIFRQVADPLDLLFRYLSRRGGYPHTVRVRTAVGGFAPVTLYSGEDTMTIVEIFCRDDYPMQGDEKTVVDFGSNIGISTVWWLSQAPSAFVHLFEPVPRNIERLKDNLRPFEGRFELNPVAVGPRGGPVEFGVEDSGRYGGVGRATGQTIKVTCVDSNEALAAVIARRGDIDVLKIDIETLEREVTERIPVEIARRIKRIYVEFTFETNPLSASHDMRRVGPLMTHFILKPTQPAGAA